MSLEVVKYGDPVLRKPGRRIESVTPELRQLIAGMFETMEAHHGIGLAAQQVGQALQLTVIDIRAVEDRPSTLKLRGEEADPKSLMPLVLINPQLEPIGETVSGAEGCLSFPEIYSDIARPEGVKVSATNQDGEPLEFECGGLLARCIQHEVDHLKGILFIDRMDRKAKDELRADIDAIATETRSRLSR